MENTQFVKSSKLLKSKVKQNLSNMKLSFNIVWVIRVWFARFYFNSWESKPEKTHTHKYIKDTYNQRILRNED